MSPFFVSFHSLFRNPLRPRRKVRATLPQDRRSHIPSTRSTPRLTPAVGACAGGTALVVSSVACRIVISSVTLFLLFCPASRGALKGEWGLLARPRAAFLEGPKNHASRFFGGTETRRVTRSGKAEARRAASAQAAFPSRRARKKQRRKKRRVAGEITADRDRTSACESERPCRASAVLDCGNDGTNHDARGTAGAEHHVKRGCDSGGSQEKRGPRPQARPDGGH